MSLFPIIPPRGIVTPASLSFLQLTKDLSDLTTYQFTNENFGSEDSTREIICVAAWRSSTTTARTISAATIGGETADVHIEASDTTGITTYMSMGIFSANVPTGTSGTVQLSLSGSCIRCAIGVFRAINLQSRTPHDTASDTEDVLNMSLDIPAQGLLAAGSFFNSNNAVTSSGLTEDWDEDFGEGADRLAGGSASDLIQETGRSISFDGSDVSAVGVSASWS